MPALPASHPLWNAYRAAIRQRDPEHGYALFQEIWSRDADDKETRKECERLQCQCAREIHLPRLREAVNARDSIEAERLLAELEGMEFARQEWEADQSVATAHEWRDIEEWYDLMKWVNQTSRATHQGSRLKHDEEWLRDAWKNIEKIGLISKRRDWAMQEKGDPQDHLKPTYETLRSALQKRLRLLEDEQALNRDIENSDIAKLFEEAEKSTRSLARVTLPKLISARSALDGLDSVRDGCEGIIRKVEDIEFKYPQVRRFLEERSKTDDENGPSEAERWKERIMKLKGRIKKDRGRLENAILMIWSMLILIPVGGISWLGYQAWMKHEAHQMHERLLAHQEGGEFALLDQRLEELKARPQLLQYDEDLPKSQLLAETWQKQQVEAEQKLRDKIESLKNAMLKSSDGELMKLPGEIQQLNKLNEQLCPELQEKDFTILSSTRRALGEYFQRRATVIADRVAEEVRALTQTVAGQLDFSKRKEILATNLSSLKPELQRLLEIAKLPETLGAADAGLKIDIPISPPTKAALSALDAQIKLYDVEIQKYETAISALDLADGLGAYKAALDALKEARLGEVADLKFLASAFPTEETLLESLLLPTKHTPEEWQAIMQDQMGGGFMPASATVSPEEQTVLINLNSTPELTGVWKHTLADGSGGQEVFSSGPLETQSIGDLSKSWKGMVYFPRDDDLSVDFKAVEFSGSTQKKGSVGRRISASSPPPYKQFVEGQIAALIPPTADRYLQPILTTFDRLRQTSSGNAEVHPLVRAYLYQEMWKLASIRPQQWGIHYCPNLRQDWTDFTTACGGRTLKPGDWMLPKMNQTLVKPLKAFFDNIENRATSYLDEAKQCRAIFSRLKSAGVRFIGMIDKGRRPRFITSPKGNDWCWIPGVEGGRSAFVEAGKMMVPNTEDTWTSRYPVFAISILPGELAFLPGIKR